MGQYYYAAILKRKKCKRMPWMGHDHTADSVIYKLDLYRPLDYDGNGLKLMEHSYWGNKYAMTVESQLMRKRGNWAPPNFAVIGDYAEVEHTIAYEKDGVKAYDEIESDVPKDHPDFRECEEAINLRCSEFTAPLRVRNAKNILDKDKTYYAWNWSKKQYVQMNGCPEISDDWKVRIDPLFILCSVGNGRGGGDYYHNADNEYLAGAWAFDMIEVSEEKPSEEWGWEELVPNFLEHY